jgi:hypothetical protein
LISTLRARSLVQGSRIVGPAIDLTLGALGILDSEDSVSYAVSVFAALVMLANTRGQSQEQVSRYYHAQGTQTPERIREHFYEDGELRRWIFIQFGIAAAIGTFALAM